MSKFSNFKIKWPKSMETLENGGRVGPLRQRLPPPPPQKKRSAGSASGADKTFDVASDAAWVSLCRFGSIRFIWSIKTLN